ncbi:hypothetical protein L6452_31418 [Arctium lappa]|uniref:Uncharacterized protein n=1 Tax=Arctium lappa TaxID=4217 RepID=A0ACB8Z2D0_ARCLA|nr:hypothetical protein L6452_31418 [Arctium lappa]
MNSSVTNIDSTVAVVVDDDISIAIVDDHPPLRVVEMNSSVTNIDTVAVVVDDISIAIVDDHPSSIPVTLMPSQSVAARLIALFGDLWTKYYPVAGEEFGENQPLMPSVIPQSFIVGAFLALLQIKSQPNAEFPFETHPRTMTVCVISLLIYAFVSAAEHIFSRWRTNRTSTYTNFTRWVTPRVTGTFSSALLLIPMEHVAAPRRRQWTDPEPTFRLFAYILLGVMIIKACKQARLPSEFVTPSRAFILLAYSLLMYALASGIYAVSRGRIYVIARWVKAVSACLMLAFMSYLTPPAKRLEIIRCRLEQQFPALCLPLFNALESCTSRLYKQQNRAKMKLCRASFQLQKSTDVGRVRDGKSCNLLDPPPNGSSGNNQMSRRRLHNHMLPPELLPSITQKSSLTPAAVTNGPRIQTAPAVANLRWETLLRSTFSSPPNRPVIWKTKCHLGIQTPSPPPQPQATTDQQEQKPPHGWVMAHMHAFRNTIFDAARNYGEGRSFNKVPNSLRLCSWRPSGWSGSSRLPETMSFLLKPTAYKPVSLRSS